MHQSIASQDLPAGDILIVNALWFTTYSRGFFFVDVLQKPSSRLRVALAVEKVVGDEIVAVGADLPASLNAI